jgi:hypothetical protein
MALFSSIVAGRGRLTLPQIAKSLDDYSANARKRHCQEGVVTPHLGQLVDNFEL